jgi:para-nitrobenzyl esterase
MQVELQAGPVAGLADGGVYAFLGVPYARADRFEAPRPATWRGVWPATTYGPAAPQPPGENFMRADLGQSEDCLSVNVWTPDPAGRRPVMVWIHGGGYRQGAGSATTYHGEQLARRGDVVVVSINYRLGALGFLSHPDLARPDGTTGNCGLLDQVEALRWVRREIAAFGGDPGNVTIFGESAGGGSVTWLMTSPLARGLVHRAICQSGPPAVPVPTSYEAHMAERLAKELDTDVAGLRGVPVDDLVAAQVRVERTSETGMAFLPTVESPIAERLPVDVFESGDAAPVPLMIGTNTDEWRLWAPSDRNSRALSDGHLLRRIEKLVGSGAGEVIETYRRERAARGIGAANNELWFAIKTDHFFRAPIRAVIDRHRRHQPTFVYLFDWKSPALGGFMGACHSVEIPFVFGTHDQPGVRDWTGHGEAADRLSAQMLAAWTQFARSGDPSTPGLAWPAFDAASKPTMWFDAHPRVESAPAEVEVAALEAASAAQPPPA